MTFQQLYEQAAILSGDPGFSIFGVKSYEQWVNDGNLYVAKRLPLALVSNLLTSKTENLLTTEEYSWQTDCLRIARIRRDGKDCDIIDLTKWKSTDRNTYCAASANIPYAMILGNKFYVKPVSVLPEGITNGLITQYVKRPATMTLVGDIPNIDIQYHPLITHYAAYIAKLIGRDATAQILLKEIDDEIANLIKLYGV